MNLLKNQSLAPLTTLRAGGCAKFFVEATTQGAIEQAVQFARKESLQVFVLGGGSNILVRDAGFPGLVLKIATRGIHVIESGANTTYLLAEAGEEWDALVAAAVKHGLFGLENMSFIPGTVGGAVVGNIGAYGAEVKDSLAWVETLDSSNGTIHRFTNAECQFAYRHSIFKTAAGRKYIVLRAGFKLSRDGGLNLQYKDIQEYFTIQQPGSPSLIEVRDAVIAIRKRKLPDHTKVGTAGSFFKNPIISQAEFEALQATYPSVPGHAEGEGRVKVALGWVLDKICHLKGYHQGPVGTHPQQALVITNNGGTASDIEKLADHITATVHNLTSLSIEWEVERL